MKTINVSGATGAALDWLVAKAEGWVNYPSDSKERGCIWHREPDKAPFGLTCPGATWKPSADWSQGGPIIEREGIELLCNLTAEEAARFNAPGVTADWRAAKRPINRNVRSFGVTPLIAAMRCYVASKLGETVEVPEELLS